jgi:hypothetical protein
MLRNVKSLKVGVALSLGALLRSEPSWACDVPSPSYFFASPDDTVAYPSEPADGPAPQGSGADGGVPEAASDTTPPLAPASIGVSIERGVGPRNAGGCNSMMTSCDSTGSIHLYPEPPEGETREDTGYLIAVSNGRPPDGLTIPAEALIASESSGIWLYWEDGAHDDQEAIDFTLTVRAVDRAGNVSEEATRVRVRHGGDAGCHAGRKARGAFSALILLALLGAALVRRRSARHS